MTGSGPNTIAMKTGAETANHVSSGFLACMNRLSSAEFFPLLIGYSESSGDQSFSFFFSFSFLSLLYISLWPSLCLSDWLDVSLRRDLRVPRNHKEGAGGERRNHTEAPSTGKVQKMWDGLWLYGYIMKSALQNGWLFDTFRVGKVEFIVDSCWRDQLGYPLSLTWSKGKSL